MSTEDKQLVEWIEHAKASDVSELADYMNAIIDFKSALREEIEKMIESEPTDNDRIYPNEKAAIEAYEKVLSLLDSVKPKK